MSWWTRAKIENYEDRNQVNATIHTLITFADTLKYAAKLIFQTARGARKMIAELSSNKTLSSFPEVVDLLDEADKIALDDPRKFADICKQAAIEIKNKIADLEEERTEFTHEKLPKRLKGLVDE